MRRLGLDLDFPAHPVQANDKADLNRGEAYTAAGEPLSHSDPAIVEAKHLVELHPGEADWPAWEFGW
jgi:hypothetical protein